ncbi:MAG: T9SS type A sorting domain-containing protein, partial [Bacteroidales bacterium]
METFTIGDNMIPVTLYYSVDEGAFEKFEVNAVYGCMGHSLDIYAEPAEDSWNWSWTSDKDFNATGRSVRIADEMTSGLYGKYYVSYSDVVNDCQVTDQLFFVWANPDCPVGINSNHNGNGVNIYPNPTDGVVRISVQEVKVVSLEIVDISGKEIYKDENINFSEELFIDLSDQKKGTYLYEIRGSENERLRGTIIKN